MKLYENIKQLRIERGWSQQELADKMGYTSKAMISKIESGQVNLQRSRIEQFANIFGVNPVDLMGFDDAEPKQDFYIGEIGAIMTALPQNRKEDLLRIAKMYAEELKNEKP